MCARMKKMKKEREKEGNYRKITERERVREGVRSLRVVLCCVCSEGKKKEKVGVVVCVFKKWREKILSYEIISRASLFFSLLKRRI